MDLENKLWSGNLVPAVLSGLISILLQGKLHPAGRFMEE